MKPGWCWVQKQKLQEDEQQSHLLWKHKHRQSFQILKKSNPALYTHDDMLLPNSLICKAAIALGIK